MLTKLGHAILFLLVAGTAAAHVPPPPLPPGFRDLNAELTNAFNRRDVKSYEKLLAKDLRVFDGDRLVAASKDQWLKTIKNLVDSRATIQSVGVVLNPDGSFYAMEQLTLRASWWGRVIKYEVKDNRIVTIRFLSGYGGGLPLLDGKSKQVEPIWK